MEYAVIDIETTGGRKGVDKITEIAIFVFDGNKIIDRFQTLIDPERSIPPSITRLTGISEGMVEGAPRFYEVARKIVEMTENRVFVAHNVNFDYGFIRAEFQALGADFQRKKLCTVRLSRKAFPGFPSYSLGNLCNSLGIVVEDRHRAGGDAEATVKVLEMALIAQPEQVQQSLKPVSREGSLPPNLDAQRFHSLPEKTGVYYFFDKAGKIIYIGKAINIRKRVMSHFLDHTQQKLGMKEKIYDVDCEVTGSELVALLKESDEIKHYWPYFNRSQKRANGNYCILLYEDRRGIKQLAVQQVKGGQVGLRQFSSRVEASGYLRKLAMHHRLCPKCCGLQNGNGPCFEFQVKQCDGVCAGEETVEDYNLKVASALDELKSEMEGTFMVLDKGRSGDERAVVLVERGQYQGFGYVDVETPIATLDDVKSVVSPFKDNSDIQRIIRMQLKKLKPDQVHHFNLEVNSASDL